MAKDEKKGSSKKSGGTDEKKAKKPSSSSAKASAAKEPESKPKKASGGSGGGDKEKKGTPAPSPKKPAYDADNVDLGDLGAKAMKVAVGIGVVGLGGGAALAGGDWPRYFHSYLIGFFYVLTIGLGALFFVTVNQLTNAYWSVAVRRVAEIFAANVPVLALLALPIVGSVVAGSDALYEWNNHQKVEQDHLLHWKAPYLNMQFFVVRCVIYFGFWYWLSTTHLKKSVEQDSAGKPENSKYLQIISAPSMLVFALTLTFCAIDFLMSLEPVFFSTMWGVYIFAGCVLAFHASAILTLFWLQNNGRLAKSVTVEHFHDLGKFMFAFIVFWSYIAFSQFMLIWYADIPEETFWFKHRFVGGWGTLGWVLLFGHFVIPFLGLLSRWVKRHRTGLAFWCVWILVIQYVDLYWLVMPALDPENPNPPFGIIDILNLAGCLGFFFASVAYTGSKLNLLPIKDPRLAKSLAFENI